MDNANVVVPARHGNTEGGVRLKTARPTISAGAYQIARRIRDDIVAIAQVDLFTAELGRLGLDDRGPPVHGRGA